MSGEIDQAVRARGNRWSLAIWGGGVALLLLPLIAMQVTDQVVWSPFDFALAAVLLASVAGAYELAARTRGDTVYRAGIGLTLLGALALIWINLAVGIIGDEGEPANLLYAGVLAVGAVGAALARLSPRGMARTLIVMAMAQALVAVVGGVRGLPITAPADVAFVAVWLTAAWLFVRAARPSVVGG